MKKVSLMKKDQVLKTIESSINGLKYCKETDKHSSVSCVFVIVYKMKNKAVKFMQNFAVEIPNPYRSDSKPLVFCKKEKFDLLNEQFSGQILDGSAVDVKKIKRSYRWALADEEFSIEKWKTNLNKKSLLPNNLAHFENVSLETQVEKVTSGRLIKVTQMNNFFSFKAGAMDKNSNEEIIKNIEAVYDFVNGKMGHLIGRVYINKNMEKANKICIRF